MVLTQAIFGATTAFLTSKVALTEDPYLFGLLYSFALMVLCVECWFSEDPQLFNGTKTAGWPFFLFRAPGEKSKAVVPMTGYTRVFSAWHAGGVCFSFFMHVVGRAFPLEQKASVALPLGLLWVIWASINSYRSVYGGAQFCQIGIAFHSLLGPGCGLAGYWHLGFWWTNRVGDALSSEELLLCSCFGIFVFTSLVWFATHERKEAVTASNKRD